MTDGKDNLRGALLALLSFGIFATHDVVVKYVGGHYSPFQVVFFSVLLGFPLVTVMLLRDRTDGNLLPRHPWWMLLRTASVVITGVSAFYAFSNLPLAQCYAILFASPLLITVLAIPILGETVRLRRGLAVVVGMIGVLIVLRPGQAEFGLGHLAALTAAVTGAFGSIVVRKIGQEERSAVLLLYPMVGNFVIMGLALPFVYKPMPLLDIGALAIIAAFAYVASLLIIAAYRRAEAVIVAPMQYSQILWATGYGFFLFDETVDAATLIGASIIIASGMYIVFREGRGSVSETTPVLRSRGRPEVGAIPRSSLLQQLRDRGAFERKQASAEGPE